jgi:hypothetical protein
LCAAVGKAPGPYSRQDVYDRVLLWRVPLIALWATTTLPARGPHTKVFTLFRLVADPIDTLCRLFYELDLAKCTAEWSTKPARLAMFTFEEEEEEEEQDDESAEQRQNENRLTRVRSKLVQWSPAMQKMDYSNPKLKQYICDAIASIITAYDEWGYGAGALKAINHALLVRNKSY